MKYTKEGLLTGKRWWYYILAWIIILFIFLCMQIPVFADTAQNTQVEYALVIEQQQESTDVAEAPVDIQPELSGIQGQKTDNSAASGMLQHVFVVVFCGVVCIALGVGVLIYHIRQDRADEAYIESVMHNYGELPVFRLDHKTQEKENYGGKTVFIRREQT